MDSAFEALVDACFSEHTVGERKKVLDWLLVEKVKSAEDYALLASDEKEVLTTIVAPSKTESVHNNKLKDIL